MADDNEKLEYGFDLDNTGFKQSVDDAFDHLSKKENEAINELVTNAKKAENASKKVNSAVTTTTIDTVEKAMSYLKMSHDQAVAYIDKLKAKQAAANNSSVGNVKQTEEAKVKVVTEAEQQQTKVVEQETKKRTRTEAQAKEELLKILNESVDARKQVAKAKQQAEKAKKQVQDMVYSNGDSATKESVNTKNAQQHTPNIAAERFQNGGVVKDYYNQANGAMRHGSPTFKGDPVGHGWGSSDPRLNNMGAYKESQYISQHPDTRMSRRELSSHLVKLNYEKKLAQQAKMRPMTNEEEYNYMQQQDQYQQWKSDTFWNMVKGKAKILKENTKKQTDDFYKSFAELNGMSVEDAQNFISKAQKQLATDTKKTKRTAQTSAGSGGSQPPRSVKTGGAFADDAGQFKGIIAALQNVTNSLDRVVKVFSENRIEKYYDNKDADENSKLNKYGYKSKQKTPEEQQDAYNNNAIKYIRSASKYAKSPEDFEHMTMDIQEVVAGMKEGFQSSELLMKELTYARDKVKERTGPKNMSGAPKTEEQIDAERKRAATDMINDAIRTSKSLEDLTTALERASRVVSGQEAIPDKNNIKYNNARAQAMNILQGKTPLKNTGVSEPTAEDEAAVAAYRESLSSVGRMFDTIKTKAKNVFKSMSDDSEQASKKTYTYFKNATRIASGIVISQAFYAGLNAIKNGITTMVQFNTAMETTQVAFEQMLGNAKAAKSMLYSVEDLAAKTPYTVDTAVDATKRLLAYGFKANEVIPVLSKLADATAITGDSPDKMERLILALGQIKVKGKLAGQELRQLYDAGIPAADIIMKKKGWDRKTFDEQVRKGAIGASNAISMLLAGITERFGGTAEKMNMTTSGLLSNIHDSLMFLGQQLFGGLQEQFRKFLGGIADKLADLRTAARTYGAGGLMEAIIPKEFQNDARRVIGYIDLIGKSIKDILLGSSSLKYILLGVMRGSLIVIEPVAMGLKVISNAVVYLNKNLGIMKPILTAIGMLLSTKMLFGVSAGILKFTMHLLRLTGITSAVNALRLVFLSMFNLITGRAAIAAKELEKLGVVMKFLVTNPWIDFIIIAIAALYELGKHAEQLRAKLSSLGGTLGGILGFVLTFAQYVYQAISWVFSALAQLIDQVFGIDLNSILQPLKDDFDLNTGALKDYTDNMNDATDATDALTNATKLFLASFDEVHQIEDQSGSGSGIGSGLGGSSSGSSSLDDKKNKDKVVALPTPKWPKIPPFPKLPPIPPLDGTAFAISMAAIVAVMQKAVETIEDKLKLKQANPNLKNALDGMGSLVMVSTSLMVGDFSTAVHNIEELLKLPSVKVNLQDSMSTLRSIVQAGLSLATGDVVGFVAGLANVFKIPSVTGAIQGSFGTITNIFSTALSGIQGNVIGFIAGLTSIFTLPSVKSSVQSALSGMQSAWDAHKGTVINIALSAANGIVSAFTGIPTGVYGAIVNGAQKVKNAFASWMPDINAFAAGIPNAFSGLGSSLASKFKGALGDVAGVLKNFAPSFTVNTSGLLGGLLTAAGVAFKNITGSWKVPGYATGGIINKQQLAMVGEGGKREAIIPLEDDSSMAPFATAVASQLASMQGGSNSSSSSSSGLTLQVGTLIADDVSLKNLAKKINRCIEEDNLRKYGSIIKR